MIIVQSHVVGIFATFRNAALSKTFLDNATFRRRGLPGLYRECRIMTPKSRHIAEYTVITAERAVLSPNLAARYPKRERITADCTMFTIPRPPSK